jgi:excisionase family DNA binding protein
MTATTNAVARLLGRQAAADYLGINLRSLERLVSANKLAPVRLPGVRRILFERTDLDRLVVGGKGRAS